jgi:hypothetical protein
MSAPITEAHRKLACDVLLNHSVSGAATKDGVIAAAQLIADSEARAVTAAITMLTCIHHTDQQRADCPVCVVAKLRAELERLKKQIKDDNRSYGCELRDPNGTIWEQATKDHARAERAEFELAEWHVLRLWGTTPEIVNEFIKGQQARIHAAQDIDAELATERARLDWLASPQGRLWQRQNESALVCRDTIDAAMKGGAK